MELFYSYKKGSYMTLLPLVLIFQFLPALSFLISNKTSAVVPAVIVFGDSIVDPGNNNAILTIVKCNFPPYGQDFVGQVPTGRFCNGKIPSDLIASALGVKEYLPAYLGTSLTPEDLLTGVSFASGGTGFDPLTAKVVSAISMTDQLGLFKEYKEKLKAIAGEEGAARIVSESLYVSCAGTDDIANTYFTTPFRQPHYDIPSYVNLLVASASKFVEELVQLGAQKLAFVGLPPIGCVPSQRTVGGGILRDCEPTRNQAAVLFNSKISQVLARLSSSYHGTKLILLDPYPILLDMIENPAKFGFDVSKKGCCGTGELEVSVLCNKLTPITCPDHTKYVFWDSYHPTEAGYGVLIDELLKRYIKYLF